LRPEAVKTVSNGAGLFHVCGMTSDSNLCRNSPHFDSGSKVDADRRDSVAQTTADNPSPFANKKFIWLDQVRADAELTPLAFMLAFVLANLVNEKEGHAWPSVERLAAECHVTENGVKKVIRRLVERGHLCVELGGGRGNTNRYRWIIKTGSAICVEEDGDGQERSRCDEMEQAVLPLSDQKGATPVAPSEIEKGNCGFAKGQQALRKGATPVAPIFTKESNYDLNYRLSPGRAAQTAPQGFDDFWRLYPKKVARTDAMQAFVRALKLATIDEILQGALRYAAERREEDPRYTKHPATWLNKGCWSDATPPPRERPFSGENASSRFGKSIATQSHGEDDLTEVLNRIREQRKRD
jgi:hypothetical protein